MIEITTGSDHVSSVFSQYMAVGDPIFISPTETKHVQHPFYGREPLIFEELIEGRIEELNPKINMFTITEDLSPVKLQEISKMISYLAYRQEEKGQYLVVSCPWDSELWNMDKIADLYDTWSVKDYEHTFLHDHCFNCKKITDSLCLQCHRRYCCTSCEKYFSAIIVRTICRCVIQVPIPTFR